MRKRSRSAIAAASLVLVLAVAGCSFSDAPKPKPTPTESVPADPALTSVFPDDFTGATAKSETVRLADAIVSLLPASIVVNVANIDQLKPATASSRSYYGVLRIISLDPANDPVAISKAMVQKIEASGWTQRESSDDATGVHLVTLSSNRKPNISWLLQLSGDPRVSGQSVIQLQLVSPDLQS
ncbi:MAG: hypothetical protein H7279_10020 [Microbacteriaceae bacterium]|nr:hypothetical protein [Microbacteriaceae bacterium]